jgi:hypothetical protein
MSIYLAHAFPLPNKFEGLIYHLCTLGNSYLLLLLFLLCSKGFQEGKTACCGSGPYRAIDSCGGKRGVTEYELCDNVADYVFFDYGHPTERVSQKVSKSWWSHTPNVKRPYTNLKEIFKV